MSVAATPAAAGAKASLPVTTASDGLLTVSFDNRLHSRVLYGAKALTEPSASETLRLADGSTLSDFHFLAQSKAPVQTEHGAGTRHDIRGRSATGIEKTVSVVFHDRYRGFAFLKVTYRNASAAPVDLSGWTNAEHVLKTTRAGFWSWSGASHPDRRDWVQPVGKGFSQPNFMGMNATDYGGGTPIVDIWRPDAGLAVGHVETSPRLISLPLIETPTGAAVAVRADHAVTLKPGESFETPQSFVAVHSGDFFRTLDTYRQIMSDRGLASPAPPAGSYEAIWCAWGYGRNFKAADIEGALGKARELGLKWAVIDDGWQTSEGDWYIDPAKFPRKEADLIALVQKIKAAGLKPRLWVSPLAVDPGTDLMHDHVDMLLLDTYGAPQAITWWNAFYLCPAYGPTIDYTKALVTRIVRDWGFEGLKIDGQHLNGVAPCYNPAHGHARPEESVEHLQDFWKAVYDTARAHNPEAVVEICPCGDCYSYFNFPYMNQAPASDPTSSWQVRLKGKSLKALMGPSAPFAGDHVELSDGGRDFASTVGIGAVVSTKFTWPDKGSGPDKIVQLTADKEPAWRKWVATHNALGLATGQYLGELYDIGFDKPEAHVIEKDGRLYYAFYAEHWKGLVEFRGLSAAHSIRDYVNDRVLGEVSPAAPRLTAEFTQYLLVEATPLATSARSAT